LRPWEGYPVRDVWVTNALAAGKIGMEAAREYYCKTVHRVGYNLAALDIVQEYWKRKALRAKMMGIEVELRKTFRCWKTIPTVQEWRSQYERLEPRYKFLVLDGGSGFGKTWFAMSLNDVGRTLYTDCTAGVPYLKEYDPKEHSAILLDEVTPRCCISIKKAMQASNEMVTLAVSPTMCNSYSVHLHRCQIICCSNVWAESLRKLKKADRSWLQKNCYFVKVTEPMWEK
jgi:hypothetical protein